MNNETNDHPPMKTRTGLAIASLLLGIISIPTLGLLSVGAILGIVLGVFALKKAKHNPAQYGGKNYAIAGIALSCLSLLLSVVITPLIVVFIVQPVKVEGTAMRPTLNHGDRIFVWKQIENIERGDIVVFWYPDDPSKSFIKRVIGLPGEAIDIDSLGHITINGTPLDESYLVSEQNQTARERWRMVRADWKVIKQHYYFVMGDNRDASNDSRSWGLVPEKYIYGKFIWRYASAD